MSAPRVIRLLLIAFLILLVSASATAWFLWRQDRRGQQLLQEAFAAFQQGHSAGALQKYDAALGSRLSTRHRAFAYGGRSTVFLAEKKVDRAIADLNQAIALAPDVSEFFLARADDYLQKGDSDRALADYSHALALSPGSFRALLQRAKIEAERKQPDAALHDLNEALRLQPGNLEALQDRGNAYGIKGDWKNALVDYESVLRLLPETQLLGRDAFRQRIAELKDRIAIDLREQGVTRFQQGNLVEAIRLYDEALTYSPSPGTTTTVLTNRANARFRLGDHEGAQKNYDEAIRITPDATLAYLNRAKNSLALGRENEALNDLDEVLRQRPDHVPALLIRADLLTKRHELEKANTDLETALQHLEELGPKERLPAIQIVAWIRATSPFAILCNGAEAVELGNILCIATRWENSKSIDTLAAAYAETGAYDKAIEMQTRALQLHDIPPEARQRMEQRLDLYRQHKPFRYPEK